LTSRAAVLAVEQAFVSELGWYPREPPAPDYGIDLYVEAAVDGVPNGRMLGVQIKGGDSFFTEVIDEQVIFRGEQRHLEYWLGHSLPVILALHDPDSRTVVWQRVAEHLVETTGKGWKLAVPLVNRLDAHSAGALVELTDGDRYTLALNALRADLGWMRLLVEGGRVWVEIEEWVNKTSGRGSIRLVGARASGGERLERDRSVFLGLRPYGQLLPELFPWAWLVVDDDFYADHEEDLWRLEEGFYDRERDSTIMVGLEFEEWRQMRGLTGLRPYQVEAGELARWRVEVALGELGEAMLVMDRHLSGGDATSGARPA
jgi:hypothetical protein